jgi:hypothetical protein
MNKVIHVIVNKNSWFRSVTLAERNQLSDKWTWRCKLCDNGGITRKWSKREYASCDLWHLIEQGRATGRPLFVSADRDWLTLLGPTD